MHELAIHHKPSAVGRGTKRIVENLSPVACLPVRQGAAQTSKRNDATPPAASGRESHPTKRNGRAKLDFSVVLPTHNRVDVLSDCLGALKRQTLSPDRFEVIVVDDGSTDGTSELCSKHKPRHEFHFVTQQNGGAGAARRLGIEHARGKYLHLDQ